MREGGNKLLNSLFEAKLKKKSVKPDNRTDLDTRSNFIYDKYQHRKWYSADGATKKKRVSAFVPPAPIGETASAEEDDFFALRANNTADDDFFGAGGGSSGKGAATGEIHFDPKAAQIDLGDRRSLVQTLTRMESKRQVLNDIKQIDIDWDSPNPKRVSQSARNLKPNADAFDQFDVDWSSPVSAKKPQSLMNFGENPFGESPSKGGDRSNLMSTLKRMESQRQVLDDIKMFDMDREDPKPKRISQSSRELREKRNYRKSHSEGSDAKEQSKRQGSHPLDKRRPRRQNSRDDDESSARSGRRRPPGRTKSMDSESFEEKPARRRPIERNNSADEATCI